MLLDGMKNENKLFWQFVKSQNKANIGVAPLHNDEGKLQSDIKEKAEILSRQLKCSQRMMVMKYL